MKITYIALASLTCSFTPLLAEGTVKSVSVEQSEVSSDYSEQIKAKLGAGSDFDSWSNLISASSDVREQVALDYLGFATFGEFAEQKKSQRQVRKEERNQIKADLLVAAGVETGREFRKLSEEEKNEAFLEVTGFSSFKELRESHREERIASRTERKIILSLIAGVESWEVFEDLEEEERLAAKATIAGYDSSEEYTAAKEAKKAERSSGRRSRRSRR